MTGPLDETLDARARPAESHAAGAPAAVPAAAEARRAPSVIFLYAKNRGPARVPLVLFWTFGAMGAAIAIGMLIIVLAARSPMRPFLIQTVVWSIVGSIAMFALGVFFHFRRKRAAAKPEVVAPLAEDRLPADDPAAAALLALRSRGALWPAATAAAGALQAVRDSAPQRPPRARVIVVGATAPPSGGEVYFEPQIISPTQFLWKRMFVMLPAAVITAVAVLDWLGVWPFTVLHLGRHFGSFAWFLITGVTVGCAWIWRTAIRPTYVRLAPGIVQVMEYRLRGAKPTIHSYPMIPGTVAVVVQIGAKPHQAIVTLARGERSDVLPLSQMRDAVQLVPHVWNALLSTAPTPPLDETELLG